MNRVVFLAVVSLAWAACGEDEDKPNPTPTPLSVRVQPTDGASEVSIIAPLKVTLSYPVTSTTDTITASLAWDRGFNEQMTYGIEVTGSLTVSGSVVTFTPTLPLVPGMTYKFSISGLVTTAGAVSDQSVRFRTWANPIDRSITYSAADTVDQYSVYTYDEDYNVTGVVSYDDPGTDTTWFTGDDEQSARTVYADPTQGSWTRLYNYNSAGADSQWGTADDVLSYHQLRTFDEHGQLTNYDSYSSLGADNEPFTGDETYLFRRHSLFDERGLMTRHTYLTGAGTDATWLTGDDAATGYNVYEYDAAGRRVYIPFYGRGVDDLLYTADDTQTGYTAYTLGVDGRRETELECGDAGTDTLWHTADDVLAGVITFEYDEAGLMTKEIGRDDAESIIFYEESEYDAAGRLIAKRRYDPGSDGDYLTSDDFVEVEWLYITP